MEATRPVGGAGRPAAALAVLLPRGHLAAAVGGARAEDHPGNWWVRLPIRWLQRERGGGSYDDNDLSSGLLMLICGDVIRPGLAWMLTRTHRYLAS